MGERPGEASVQYNDVRGEAAGDVSDLLHVLDNAAKKLGYERGGQVVGIRIYGGDEGRRNTDLVDVTFQVVEDPCGADNINKALVESGGELAVKEYVKREVPVVDFMRCFKRLKVSLFSRYIEAREISVDETIYLDDEED